MRRTDHDSYIARQGPPPFRVLPDNKYLSPTPPVAAPPPPPAPEPYKVAPTSTSFGRAHRRSSFVILAESGQASPETGDASSTLPTGRVSPFRGRGFKGPPPRSMSRPQSPEVAGDGRRRRVERRVSLSQQNSPRRSLIPQPTYRQRSSSLTKDNERSPSPKIGRRVDSRTRLNISDSRGRLNASDSKSRLNDSKTRLNRFDSRSRTNLAEAKARFISNSTSNLTNSTWTTTRRQPVTKGTKRLSPIQGTPTKPEKTTPRSNVTGKDATRPSPTKTSRTSSQKNSVAVARRDSQSRSPSKDRLLSPSKIPLKANKANGSSITGRFISMAEQNSGRTDRFAKDGRNDKQIGQSVQNGRSESSSKENEVDGNISANVDDVDLIDLLKQTTQATGTSSERLVNTTATTAVQPLHIDANALLVERNDSSTTNQQKDRSDGTLKSSVSPASKGESPASLSTSNAASTGEKASVSVENQPIRASHAINPGNDKKDAESGIGGHSKNGSVSQSVKNVRMSDEVLTNQRSGRNSQNTRGPKPSDGKVSDEPEVASVIPVEVKSSSAGSKTVTSRDVLVNDKMPTVKENDSRVRAVEETATAAANNVTVMSNNATTTNNVARGNNSVSPAVGAVNAGVNSDAVVRARNKNHGSDASLKSSTGVSTDSIESVRSTDTGVSVNTVRGVSSPREKTGVHTVKRPQEIETLSGNIVRVEQNGEPAVLASNNEKQRDSEKLLARWGRSLSQYCKCCSGMRCLACRRDPKGLLWTRNQGRTAVINDIPSPVATHPVLGAPPPSMNALSCWSKLKARCRCVRLRERLREVKCCTRKARIAPAEPTVCCPPERRCGAICRRAFGWCKCSCCKCSRCKRADTQPRTRNTRAKHSLTSVAPPPLSEEPKAKIPDVLVEHNSIMRGAIPCLPVPLAWFCLVWNFLLPGTGTVWSGLFNLCTGQPRFSAVAGARSRIGALIVNLIVGVGQMFTVLFCLVGWGWSIWWGVTMIRLARKYKRFKVSEAANNDPEARGGQPALPPGVPSQALRGMERAR